MGETSGTVFSNTEYWDLTQDDIREEVKLLPEGLLAAHHEGLISEPDLITTAPTVTGAHQIHQLEAALVPFRDGKAFKTYDQSEYASDYTRPIPSLHDKPDVTIKGKVILLSPANHKWGVPDVARLACADSGVPFIDMANHNGGKNEVCVQERDALLQMDVYGYAVTGQPKCLEADGTVAGVLYGNLRLMKLRGELQLLGIRGFPSPPVLAIHMAEKILVHFNAVFALMKLAAQYGLLPVHTRSPEVQDQMRAHVLIHLHACLDISAARDFEDHIVPYMAYCEGCLKRNPGSEYLVGTSCSLADLALYHVVSRAKHCHGEEYQAAESSLVKALHDRVEARPRIAAFLESDMNIKWGTECERL